MPHGISCRVPGAALAIGAWCALRHVPGHIDAEARSLVAQLGLSVKLGGVKYLRPGAVLYEGVELADPETGNVVFRCRLLEVARQSGASGRSDASSSGKRPLKASSAQDSATTAPREPPERGGRPVIAVIASQSELETATTGKTWQWLDEVLRERLGRLEADVRISAAEMTLNAAEGSQTLTGVEGFLENSSGGTTMLLRFRLAGADTPEPARLRIVRNRQLSPPATAVELYTGDGELPCRLLAIGAGDLGSMVRAAVSAATFGPTRRPTAGKAS